MLTISHGVHKCVDVSFWVCMSKTTQFQQYLKSVSVPGESQLNIQRCRLSLQVRETNRVLSVPLPLERTPVPHGPSECQANTCESILLLSWPRWLLWSCPSWSVKQETVFCIYCHSSGSWFTFIAVGGFYLFDSPDNEWELWPLLH